MEDDNLMTQEMALGMHGMFAEQIEREFQTTCRVIAAVPNDKGDYKPDPKSMSALELAWHIASSEVWFIESIAGGAFNAEEHSLPAGMTNASAVLDWYKTNFASAMAKFKAMNGEQCLKVLNFYNVMQLPAIFFAGFDQNHVIHHRGQLSVYLRPMGSKVPSIYGGSADEPFEMPAGASA
jgi:uncharacterized damage-inducible protein DinB